MGWGVWIFGGGRANGGGEGEGGGGRRWLGWRRFRGGEETGHFGGRAGGVGGGEGGGLALALEGEGGLGCGFVSSEAFLWIPFPFLGVWDGGVRIGSRYKTSPVWVNSISQKIWTVTEIAKDSIQDRGGLQDINIIIGPRHPKVTMPEPCVIRANCFKHNSRSRLFPTLELTMPGCGAVTHRLMQTSQGTPSLSSSPPNAQCPVELGTSDTLLHTIQ